MREVDGLVGGRALGRLEEVGRSSQKKLVSRVAIKKKSKGGPKKKTVIWGKKK